jgi:hypothetical protein
MKTKNTNQQMKIKNPAGTENNKNSRSSCCKQSAIPFYITIVSITAIFALLTIFLLEKNETLKCVKNGLVQKVEGSKIIWTKP